jgi:hypothetical protein
MSELSDTKVRNAKPADKEYTLADGQGLSVRVQVNGTKIWLYRYRFGGKRAPYWDTKLGPNGHIGNKEYSLAKRAGPGNLDRTISGVSA